MVDPSTLEHSFRQSGNTCILASYAIASTHFTQYEVKDFFQDYCAHIGKSTNSSAEAVYDNNFHKSYTIRNVPGYRLIVELHRMSEESSFKDSRKEFDIEFISDVKANMKRIKKSLIDEEALLSGSFPVGGNYHSALFGFFDNSFYYIDTRSDAAPNGLVNTDSLDKWNIGDGILFTKS